MLRTALALSALLFVAAPAAQAQLTAAKASKQLKAELASRARSNAKAMAGDKKAFLATLKAFEAEVKQGDYSPALLEDLFAALQVTLDEISRTVASAGNSVALVSTARLSEHADGDKLAGLYPDGFAPGDGGPIQRYLQSVDASADAVMGSLRKKLEATARLLEKKAGVGLSVVMPNLAIAPRAVYYDEEVGFYNAFQCGISADCVWAVSDLAAPEDGLLLASGLTNNNMGKVDVTVTTTSDDHAFEGQLVPDTFFRWSAVFDDGGLGLPEGIYALTVTQGTGGPVEGVLVGIR
jgi:hypothetical protein